MIIFQSFPKKHPNPKYFPMPSLSFNVHLPGDMQQKIQMQFEHYNSNNVPLMPFQKYFFATFFYTSASLNHIFRLRSLFYKRNSFLIISSSYQQNITEVSPAGTENCHEYCQGKPSSTTSLLLSFCTAIFCYLCCSVTSSLCRIHQYLWCSRYHLFLYNELLILFNFQRIFPCLFTFSLF